MTMSIDREEFAEGMKQIMQGFDRICDKIDRLSKCKNCLDGEELLDNQDVCLLFKMSVRSLQRYRTEKKLPYCNINGKVYYKASEVRQFIQASFEKKIRFGK